MSYQNNGQRNSYQNQRSGGNYQNRGSYANRNSSENGRNNYQQNSPQNSSQREKRTESKFRIKGIVCNNQGNAISIKDTSSGPIGFVSIMTTKNFPTDNIDRDGKRVWDKVNDYYSIKLVGPTADAFEKEIVVHSCVEIVGEMYFGRDKNGNKQLQFKGESYKLISVPRAQGSYQESPSQHGRSNEARPQSNQGRQTYQNNASRPQSRTSGNGYSGGISYEQRPNGQGMERPVNEEDGMSESFIEDQPTEDDIPF